MPSREGKYALIVEDSNLYSELMELTLHELGFKTDTAHSLREALAKSDKNYDLIVLDLKLPDASKYQSLLAIRPAFKKSAIMVVSGYIDDSDAIKLLKLGADHCVKKPCDFEHISREVNKALRDNPLRSLLERISSHPEFENS